jgi:hypothetical protein
MNDKSDSVSKCVAAIFSIPNTNANISQNIELTVMILSITHLDIPSSTLVDLIHIVLIKTLIRCHLRNNTIVKMDL